MFKFKLIYISLILCNQLFADKQTEVTLGTYKQGGDATMLVNRALQQCRTQKATKLVIPKGTYHFWPNLASEKYIFISNNDEGLKRNVFDLSGIRNLEIEGQGSEFIFHGFVCPFLLDNSKNIKINNLSIDYVRTFHSEGKIVKAYTDSLDVEFSEAYPYKVENYKLLFVDGEKTYRDNGGVLQPQLFPYWHILEFDSAKREPSYMALDYLNIQNMLVHDLGKNKVRIGFAGLKGTVGNVLVFNAKDRLCPAFTISDCANISLYGVTIYHAGGIGVVAQRSSNISLDNVKVIAAPKSGRMISTIADATHFVNCKGKISMQNCTFESMMDDATNIHGIYVRIDEKISDKALLVKFIHYEQWGFKLFTPNKNVEFVNAADMTTVSNNQVSSVERLNKEYTIVTFKNKIPETIKLGDAIASTDDNAPEVTIRNCRISKNRARGFLLGSRGKTLIENNYFHTQWAAIDLAGDARSWYEQGGVRDLTFRNNVFDNCNYGGNIGLGVIVAGVITDDDKRDKTFYHQNITIENNTFRIYNPSILRMYSVDNVVFKNNTIDYSTDYKLPVWFAASILQHFDITNAANINIEPQSIAVGFKK